MQETRILSRINRQKLLSPASASPKHTKFRADVFTILSAFCLVFFVFARYNHTLQRTLGGAAAPIPEKEVCSMRNWFSRHPVSFMAFYLLFTFRHSIGSKSILPCPMFWCTAIWTT